MCKQLGISGNNLKKELTERVCELPEMYDLIAKNIKAIDNVVEFYNAFVDFTFGEHQNGGCVPMVKYLIGKNLIKN